MLYNSILSLFRQRISRRFQEYEKEEKRRGTNGFFATENFYILLVGYRKIG
jgi:hypothetical protein